MSPLPRFGVDLDKTGRRKGLWSWAQVKGVREIHVAHLEGGPATVGPHCIATVEFNPS